MGHSESRSNLERPFQYVAQGALETAAQQLALDHCLARTWPPTGHTIGRSVRSAADAVASIDSNGAAKHPRGPTDQPESDG